MNHSASEHPHDCQQQVVETRPNAANPPNAVGLPKSRRWSSGKWMLSASVVLLTIHFLLAYFAPVSFQWFWVPIVGLIGALIATPTIVLIYHHQTLTIRDLMLLTVSACCAFFYMSSPRFRSWRDTDNSVKLRVVDEHHNPIPNARLIVRDTHVEIYDYLPNGNIVKAEAVSNQAGEAIMSVKLLTEFKQSMIEIKTRVLLTQYQIDVSHDDFHPKTVTLTSESMTIQLARDDGNAATPQNELDDTQITPDSPNPK